MVPLPVIGAEAETDLRELGEEMVNELPDGVIVMFDPAVRLRLSDNPFKLRTTVAEAILEDVTAPGAN